ncbi:MAG: hypothetical protein LBR70_04255 [Lactobacillaceae bacterium]|jgi:hypothetical protein|nr:hypothetical protein [Lactobacillaceae bacterium]
MFTEKLKSIEVGTNLQGLYDKLAEIIENSIKEQKPKDVVEAALVYDVLLALYDFFDIGKLVHVGSETPFEPIRDKSGKLLFFTDLKTIETRVSEAVLFAFLFSAEGQTYLVLEVKDRFYWVLEAEPAELEMSMPYMGTVGEA